ESRSPTSSYYDEEEERFVLIIPDNEGSSRWYRFRLYSLDLIEFSQERDLPLELDIVRDYWAKRVDGLGKLNDGLMAELRPLKALYLQEGNLPLAERIQRKIEKLEGENSRFSKN
ncbi:MAG: hypothetical protein AAF191_08370, partial [Verrucomicrobiota bacterium]